jgi:hypothetical protein
MKNENESTPWMTASQYSRHRAISRQYVAQMIKGGLLPMRGTLINAVEADRLLDDRPDAREPAVGDQASRYAEAKTIRTVFQAKLARLEFESRQGKLIEAAGVRQRIAGHLAAIRIGLDGLTDRLTTLLAGERDVKRVHAIMTREIREELVRMSAVVGGHAHTDAPPEV